jgi:hypothetical protein
MSSWRKEKKDLYLLTIADGTPVNHGTGWIRQELRDVELDIAGHLEKITLDITIIKYDVILGIAWLQKHNLVIDWKA